MMTQVIDNFLDEEDFKSIQDYLMGSDISWLKSPVLREGSLHPPDLEDMREITFSFGILFIWMMNLHMMTLMFLDRLSRNLMLNLA